VSIGRTRVDDDLPPGGISNANRLRRGSGRLDPVKLLYKPFGILLGLLAGFLSRKLFDRMWALIDREDPPKPTTQETTWPKVVAAAAVEGVTFRVTRAVVDRAGAQGFSALTGTWPGEKRAEPEDE
jgi:hypothetical protein